MAEIDNVAKWILGHDIDDPEMKRWFNSYLSIFKEIAELAYRKQNDYGPDNIGLLGIKGLFPRIFDKVNRMRTLVWEGKPQMVKENEDKIENIFFDEANYSIFGGMILRNCWYGKKSKKGRYI